MTVKNVKKVFALAECQRVTIVDQSFLYNKRFESVRQWEFDEDFPAGELDRILALKVNVMFFTSDNWLIIYAS